MNFGSLFTISKTESKPVGTPGAVHPRGHRETDRRAQGQRGPHPSDAHPRGGLTGRDLTVGEVTNGEVLTFTLYSARQT
jgi:hypothetical protein